MSVQAINGANTSNSNVRKHFPVKETGYIATGVAVASGIAGANKKLNVHRWLAYIAGVFTALHIGLVEFAHKKISSLFGFSSATHSDHPSENPTTCCQERCEIPQTQRH